MVLLWWLWYLTVFVVASLPAQVGDNSAKDDDGDAADNDAGDLCGGDGW